MGASTLLAATSLDFGIGPAFLSPTNLAFTGAVVLLSVLYWAAVPARLRPHFLLLLSLTYTVLLTSWKSALILAPILFVHFCARRHEASGRSTLRLALGAVLGYFILLKAGMLLRLLETNTSAVAYIPIASVSEAAANLLPMGISYCLFRLIHYIVEVHRGRLKAGGLRDLALFVLWFPTFRAGPIHRYNTFKIKEKFAIEDFNHGLMRIIVGTLKKVVLADILIVRFLSPWVLGLGLALPLHQLVVAYVLTFLVYFDFSGYSDLAVGASRLYGFKVLENFDYPLTSSNPAVFWRKWHMSLNLFIRDYFFFPFFARATSLGKMMLGMFLAFVFSQVWHAFTLNFLLLGVYHGLLMALWGWFDRYRRNRAWAKIQGRPGKVIGVLITFHLVAAGFLLFFWGNLPAAPPPPGP